MSELIFSGPVEVSIQGQRVLRLKERYDDRVEYTVPGFGNQIVIYDYREKGLETIDLVLATNHISLFPDQFNGPAYVTIYDLASHEPMVIELRDTGQTRTHLLWLAIGLNEEIPIYEYDVVLIQQMDESHIAILALLDVAVNKLYVSPHDSSSKPSTISKSISSRKFSFNRL